MTFPLREMQLCRPKDGNNCLLLGRSTGALGAFRSPLIPSTCRPRGSDRSPTAVRGSTRWLRATRTAGLSRNTRKHSSCNRAWRPWQKGRLAPSATFARARPRTALPRPSSTPTLTGPPPWPKEYTLGNRESLRGVKYLLTFRPFGKLPAAVQKAYLAGDLHLIPFPGSLVFWGTAPYKRLQRQLPLAQQIPLLHIFPRHENPHGMREPQSGWMHEPHPDRPEPHDYHGPVRNTYKRSHRWERVHRYEDELT